MIFVFLRSALACTVFLLFLCGCVSQPKNTLAPGNEGAPGVERFLVCAPNLVLSLPPELQAGTTPLLREIETYLQEHGRGSSRLSLYDGRLLWKRSVAQAKEQGSIGAAVRIFAAKLAEHFDFEALIMPSILLHTTRVTSSKGSWDGVQRTLRKINTPRRAVGGRGQDLFYDGIALGGVSGEVSVISVHLLVFSKDGERIFEGRGGLDFIHEIDLSPAKDQHWNPVLRGDLFADRKILRESIEIAFNPYLTPTEHSGQ